MNQYKKWAMQCRAREAVDILARKHYDAHYAENVEDALKTVIGMIPEQSSVAVGGSETLGEMGMIDILRNGSYKFFDRYQKLPHEEIVEIMRQSLLADFLITGTNAITRDGELVNMDCTGNRVAGMIFGPKRVIVVAGANKLVDNMEQAMERIKHETPCTETGRCMDCRVKKRLCNYLTVINNGWKFEGRISVIVIADEVGF